MSRVIKNGDGHRNGVAAFEHSTLESMLPSSLSQNGHSDPTAVLIEAREEAARKVEEAYAEGMRRGEVAGETAFRDSVGSAAEALNSAAQTLKNARDEFVTELEPQLVKLASAMAAQILRRESTIDTELVQRTARSVLQHVMDQERVVLKVHPDDVDTMKTNRITMLEDFDGIEHLEIFPDPAIERGGCVAVTNTLHVDGRLESQLEIILSQLSE